MRIALVIASAGLAGLAVGCGKESATTHRASWPEQPVGPPRLHTVPETEPFVAGRRVYNTNGCPKCHLIDIKPRPDSSETKNSVRKDLTSVGANHSRAWILDHVRDPTIHQPQSRMPAYEKKINDKDLGELADFLANQR